MKFVQAIRRFFATSWLVAAPLIIVVGLVAVLIFLAIVQAIVGRVFGDQAADYFASLWFGALMWAAELTLLFAPIALVIYGIVILARRLARKRQP